mgnify:CR=1 FL=1
MKKQDFVKKLAVDVIAKIVANFVCRRMEWRTVRVHG